MVLVERGVIPATQSSADEHVTLWDVAGLLEAGLEFDDHPHAVGPRVGRTPRVLRRRLGVGVGLLTARQFAATRGYGLDSTQNRPHDAVRYTRRSRYFDF
jgi:hypothetical protein